MTDDLSNGIKIKDSAKVDFDPDSSKEVWKLMAEDYERVIFFLLERLDMERLKEINVVMKDEQNEGYEFNVKEYEFKIKKPDSKSKTYVSRIEYLSTI